MCFQPNILRRRNTIQYEDSEDSDAETVLALPSDSTAQLRRQSGTIMWGLCRVCGAALGVNGGRRLTRGWVSYPDGCNHDERVNALLTTMVRLRYLKFAVHFFPFWIYINIVSLYIFQRQGRIPPSLAWQSIRAVGVIRSWALRLSDALSFLNFYFAETTRYDQQVLAPSVWVELCRVLLRPLGEDNTLMSDLAFGQGVERYNLPPPIDPQPDAELNGDWYVCRVCWDRRANTVIRNCGHVFCLICIRMVHQCPVCRACITGLLNLFY